tara:strand:- start:241 stop:411 length:171 start_codon:yes stop_codon:yes gene_type:complete
MNFKERGITVGDLLLVIVLVTAAVFTYKVTSNLSKERDNNAQLYSPHIQRNRLTIT